jgi:histidyl-tRNA synthetase
LNRFEATIEEAPRGGAFVAVPPDVVESLGGGGRIPVVASFDGIDYRGSIVRMGGETILGILKAIRQELGKEPGDQVVVVVAADHSEREVEMPEELAAALAASPAARAAFDALSYSHRREHAGYVAEAKQSETRQRRAGRTVERLLG